MKNLLNILLVLILTPVFAIALDDKSKKIEVLTKRINKYGKLAQLHFQRAQFYMQRKDYKEAFLDINKAMIIDPKMQGPVLLLAKLYLAENKNEEAVKSLKIFIKSSKDENLIVQANFLLADAYVANERYEDAAVQYESMKDTKAKFREEYYIGLSEVYYRLGDYKKSIKLLKGAMTTDLKKDLLQRKIVELSMEEGNYSLAMSMIDHMLIKDIHNAELYYMRARILQEQGKTEEMEHTIKKARFSLKNKTENKKQLTGQLNKLYASI